MTSLLLPHARALDLSGPLAAFRDDGVARLGKVAAPEVLATLRARVDQMMLGELSYPGLFFQKDTDSGQYGDLTYGRGWEGPSLNYRKIEKLELDPHFLAWIENPLFERIARALIPGGVVLYRAVIFNKAATGGTELPFHQDGGQFWGVDRDPFLQIWTALDDCPRESGCVEVVPGTHRWGLATAPGGKVPEPIVEKADVERRVVAYPAEAGEVLLIHNHVWHRSGRNQTGKARRALTVCFMTADTRCLRKRRAPRTFFPLFDRRPR